MGILPASIPPRYNNSTIALISLQRKASPGFLSTGSSHCTFAGYIPREIVTSNRTITTTRPSQNIKSIFVGCYEQKGFKEFLLKNPRANHLIFNVYSNYYQDAQLRQVKFLIKDDNVLYSEQKSNGTFKKDNMWSGEAPKLTRQKGSS